MGFPLLLNKALAEVKKQGAGLWTGWTLLGHVQSGQVGFPLLLNKALASFSLFGGNFQDDRPQSSGQSPTFQMNLKHSNDPSYYLKWNNAVYYPARSYCKSRLPS